MSRKPSPSTLLSLLAAPTGLVVLLISFDLFLVVCIFAAEIRGNASAGRGLGVLGPPLTSVPFPHPCCAPQSLLRARLAGA